MFLFQRHVVLVLVVLIWWLCIATPPAFADSGTRNGTSSHSQSPADVLKEFLATKREIGEIIYTWHLPANPRPIPGLGKPMPEIKAAFRAKWQPGAYFFMQLKGTNHLDSPTKDQVQAIVGKVGNKAWAFDNGYLRIYDEQLSGSAAKNLSNEQHWALSQLYAALGFGILHIPGSLQWDENNFVAVPLGDGTLEGRLTTLDNGLPDEIITTFNGHQGRLKLRYGGPNGRKELPDGYDRVTVSPDGKRDPGTEVRILSISLTNSLLPPTQFGPEAVLASLDAAALPPNERAVTHDLVSEAPAHTATRSQKTPPDSSVTTIVYSNKHDFFVRGHTLVRMTGPPEHSPRGLFLVVAMALVAIPFALFFLTNRKKRQETK